MTSDCEALERLLHQDIPLTRAMGLGVADWTGETLRLHVPLAPNLNHTQSMFGGSLYCAAVLAGWGWLHLRLQAAGIVDGHIVIQEGQISYPQPVLGDALAECGAPGEAQSSRFVALYRRRGRARLALHSRIAAADGSDAVRFSGQYVLHR